MVIFNLSPVLEPHDKLYNCKCRSHLWVQETSGNLFLLTAHLQRIPDRREILDHPTAHKDTFEFIFKNIFFQVSKPYIQLCPILRENVITCKGH